MAILVSGCPRSGTSLMMDALRAVFGDERIVGTKFPQETRKELYLQQDGENDARYAIRQYMIQEHEKSNPNFEYEDMNPNGFWECQYSVRGIKYNFADRENLLELEKEDINEAKIIKVVSQGLISSDPKYIHKVIYMIRHPRSVAKSQERLQRGMDVYNSDGDIQNMFDDVVIHTPEMYISVTINACHWLLNNPDIPVHFVYFDELVRNPKEILSGVQEFMGSGDFSKAYDIIEPKLKRSKPQDIENKLWEDAEFVYEAFKEHKFQEVIDYFDDPKRQFNRVVNHWHCARSKTSVNCFDCKQCNNNSVVRENYKKMAERRGVDWRNEPCFFECGYDVDTKVHVSIENSIRNNHWL